MYKYVDIAMRPFTVLTTFDETLAAIVEVCRHYDAEAWLFGSRAHGRATAKSDIDVAIRCENFDALQDALEAIETTLPIDIVNLDEPYLKGIEHGWRRIA